MQRVKPSAESEAVGELSVPCPHKFSPMVTDPFQGCEKQALLLMRQSLRLSKENKNNFL